MRTKFYAALLLTFLISATAYAQKVNIDYDKKTNFSSYKTYSWAEGTPAKNPLGHQRIIAGVEAQLAAKGWQKVESNPDVVVIYSAATSTKTQINTFNTGGPWGGYRWGWGGYGGSSTTTVQEILVGQLIVDMADVKDKAFIWRGTASDTLSDNPEKNQKKLGKSAGKDVQELSANAWTEVIKKFSNNHSPFVSSKTVKTDSTKCSLYRLG